MNFVLLDVFLLDKNPLRPKVTARTKIIVNLEEVRDIVPYHGLDQPVSTFRMKDGTIHNACGSIEDFKEILPCRSPSST